MIRPVYFIVNPISGGKDKSLVIESIQRLWGDQASIHISNYASHAVVLAKEALELGYETVVAIGGDGTIHEVAKVLIGTPTRLGIVPFGSGNGLARHQGIPLTVEEALQTIQHGKEISIDTCLLNGEPFVNMAGVGFDAHIGSLFADKKNKKRGFSTYIKESIKAFVNYVPRKYEVHLPNTSFQTEAFLISFANSSQYGNNAYIAPFADMQDGLLEVCILKKFHFWSLPKIAHQLFNKKMHHSPYLEIIQTPSVSVKRIENEPLHVDGEPFASSLDLEVSIVKNSLKILVP